MPDIDKNNEIPDIDIGNFEIENDPEEADDEAAIE